jgi:hypothetical protein
MEWPSMYKDMKICASLKYTVKTNLSQTQKALPKHKNTVKESDESYFYIEVKSLYTYMLNYEEYI